MSVYVLGCPGNPDCNCRCPQSLGAAVADWRDEATPAAHGAMSTIPAPTSIPCSPYSTGIKLEIDGRMLLGVLGLAIVARVIARR